MCFNMSLAAERTRLEQDFHALFTEFPLLEGIDPKGFCYYGRSGFTHPLWPVIRAEDPERFTPMYWGLVPHWVKDREQALKIRNSTLNARVETLSERPSFRESFKRGQRCLIPVDGFYEPHHHQGTSYPFYLHRDSRLFALAGIHARWTGPETGKVYDSFSVVTAPAEGLLESIHNRKHRMPLILGPGQYAEWLEGSPGLQLDREFLSGMKAHPVSRGLYRRDGSVSHDASIQDLEMTGIAEVDALMKS